jgi:hypothetical protein
MRADLKRTLLVDVAIVAVLVALAFVLAPGMAVIGLLALLVLLLGALSFATSGLLNRRRRRRLAARRRGFASEQPSYPPRRTAAGRVEPSAVRRVPANRRTQPRRKRLG